MKLAEDKDEVAPNSAPLEDFNCGTSGQSDDSPVWHKMAQVCSPKLSVWKSLEPSNIHVQRDMYGFFFRYHVGPSSRQEMYLFANDGENHTNNVKQLENMKKALEDTNRC